MKLYIASPMGFSEAGREFYYQTLLPLLKNAGHVALDPWTLTDPAKIDAIRDMPYGVERREAFRILDEQIGRVNTEAIHQCDAVLAVLDGVDIDSGTAAEIGYACAKGKPIIGYRGDIRLSSDNEGAMVNLQVEYFIHLTGGKIVMELAQVVDALAMIQR